MSKLDKMEAAMDRLLRADKNGEVISDEEHKRLARDIWGLYNCECGSDSINSGGHSTWCPKNDTE